MALRKTYILYLALVMVGFCLPAIAAPTTAPQTCDPEYWKSLSSKAWLEAEREIVQNKNLIYKADSVMEYVCFDSFMQHAAKHLGDIFTHTKYYNGKEIIPRSTTLSLEHALTVAVTNSYKTYINSNFGDMFLGERSKEMSMVKDRTLGDASSMGNYACDLMRNVWLGAKCENFIDKQAFEGDGFYPFDNIYNVGGTKVIEGYKDMDDPRKYPDPCPKPTHADWNWAKAIPNATNSPVKPSTYTAGGTPTDVLYPFKVPNKKTYDDIRPKLIPGSCSAAIPTGVTVITDSSGSGGYADGVCSNPGCVYFRGGTCVTGETASLPDTLDDIVLPPEVPDLPP